MYEPIIDPMIFYWMDVLSKVQTLPIPLAFLSLISVCVAGMAYIEYSDEQNIVYKVGKRLSCVFILLFLISLPLSFFIPDKDTMYKMLIAKQVTPHNIQVTRETAEKLIDTIGEKLDKVADKATDKVVRVVQEVKK